MRFLDNVLQDFIDRAPDEMARAKYSAMRERSVGMGVMGFHSFLQMKGIAFESAMAKSWNMKMFKHIAAKADEASMLLAQERGACPDAAERGRDAALLATRWRSRRPPRSASSAAAPAPASSRSRPTSTPTRPCRAASSVKNPYLQKLLAAKSKDSTTCGTRSSSTAARSSTSIS
jgi:ribonucleoside-diphosphate reductase alpha chain